MLRNRSYVLTKYTSKASKDLANLINNGKYTYDDYKSGTFEHSKNPAINISEMSKSTFDKVTVTGLLETKPKYVYTILGGGSYKTDIMFRAHGSGSWISEKFTSSKSVSESFEFDITSQYSVDYYNKNYAVSLQITDTNTSNDSNAITGTITLDDVNVNFQYTLKSYTIKYYIDGVQTDITYDIEGDDNRKSITLPNPTKKGYTFNGWCEGSENATPQKTVTISVGVTGDKIYYAKFTKDTYTITCNPKSNDGIEGILGNTTLNYQVDTETFSLINPTPPTGYVFTGWVKSGSSSASTKVTIAKGSTGNQTYTATYALKNYQINYIYDYNSDGKNDWNTKITNKDVFRTTFTIQDNFTLPIPEHPGYTFEKWIWDGGEGKDALISSGTSQNLTFTAQFSTQKKRIQGKFIIDGKSFTPTSEQKKYLCMYIINHQGDQVDITGSGYEVDYFDGYNIQEVWVSFNNKKYRTPKLIKNGIEYPDTFSITGLSLSPDNTENVITAELDEIKYNINITLFDENGANKLYDAGQIITDNPDDEKNNNIVYNESNGVTTIKNLKYEDKRKICVIPYVNSSSNNSKYVFSRWQGQTDDSVILSVEVTGWEIPADESVNPSRGFSAELKSVLLNDSIEEDKDDLKMLQDLVEKGVENFVLKNKVSKIGPYAFYDCKNLEYIFIPGASFIGEHAFANCEKLKDVVISSDGVGLAGSGQLNLNTFDNCPNLNLLVLPGEQFVVLNNPFCETDDQDTNSTNENSQSNFAKGIGRIYVNPNLYSQYTNQQTNGNWKLYTDVIFSLNEKIYKIMGE